MTYFLSHPFLSSNSSASGVSGFVASTPPSMGVGIPLAHHHHVYQQHQQHQHQHQQQQMLSNEALWEAFETSDHSANAQKNGHNNNNTTTNNNHTITNNAHQLNDANLLNSPNIRISAGDGSALDESGLLNSSDSYVAGTTASGLSFVIFVFFVFSFVSDQ